MICPRCGFDNPGGSFCGKCGAQLAVQIAPLNRPPAPGPRSRKTLFIAIVAVVVVVAVMLAAVLVFLPKADQLTPQAALTNYFDGAKEHDANKLVDNMILHFDTANRSRYIENIAAQWGNMAIDNFTVISMEDISMSNTPADIQLDVTNFTTVLRNAFGFTIQESQFVKATTKETKTSVSVTAYLLFSMVDGKWYYDILSYSTDDWAEDRSMGDKGIDFSSLPLFESVNTARVLTGSFTGTNSSGFWSFTLDTISLSSVRFTDCEVQMAIGGQSSIAIAIPLSLKVTIPISGTANSYDLTIDDFGTSGYLSAGDVFMLGPINNATGKNAYQPAGRSVSLFLIEPQTERVFAMGTLIIY